MKERKAPAPRMIYVCGGKSCKKKGGGKSLRKSLKDALKETGQKKEVRVVQCTCLDACGKAPNVMLEPEHQMLSEIDPDKPQAVLDRLIGEK